MRAVLVVVANILREQAFQVAFVNCDDVIQEITPATPYPTLCDSILPRTFERSADRIHPRGSNRCRNFQSILGIPIERIWTNGIRDASRMVSLGAFAFEASVSKTLIGAEVSEPNLCCAQLVHQNLPAI